MTTTKERSAFDAESSWYAILTTLSLMSIVAISVGMAYLFGLLIGDVFWETIQMFTLPCFLLNLFWAVPLMASGKFRSWLFDASAWLARSKE